MNTSNENKTNRISRLIDQLSTQRGLRIVIIASAVLLVISIAALVLYFGFRPKDTRSARPLVLIHSPSTGDELVIGQRVDVHATARDDQGITRIELWVDDELENVETTSLSEGLNPFPMFVSWVPESEGDHTLTVRAFNSRGARSSASIVVEGIWGGDRDGDGLEDSVDACPEIYGAGEDGCPLPGDGDGDGVPDGEDLCPEAPGEADDLGCPDRDGDGIPDHLDADPEEAGPADLEGAPDMDGDGVPDVEDLRPDEPGAPEDGGAPESDAGDRDGDGAADDVDPCPDDPGAPEDGYCPPPSEDEPPAAEEGGEPGAVDFFHPLEVEAYSFTVGDVYQNIWCYVGLGEEPIEQYEFEPEGDRDWNIREVLAGDNSVHLAVPSSQDLDVSIECLAQDTDGLLQELGTYSFSHTAEDWDGRELVAVGTTTGEGGFVARYRICSPTCGETAIQPPVLHPITLGPRGEGPYTLRWQWEGDEDWLHSFILLINGNLVDSATEIDSDWRSFDLIDYVPRCGEVLEFEMFAYGSLPGDSMLQRSPASNTQIWDGGTCPRTVLVTFLELDPVGRSDSPGPIYGSFYANDQRLTAEYREGRSSFDATDDPEWYLDRIINIPFMFAEIERTARSCIGSGCTSNYAPSTSSIEVELGSRETLTFGASLWTEDGRLFEAFGNIPAGEIVPGEYTVSDSGIEMTVLIDVLVGPEAGGEDNLPDLVTTGVSREEDSGQLRIHVFNNAADLIGEDLVVSIVDMTSGETLFTETWYDVTIPSGSSQTLMSPEVVRDSPYDLRILLDPADPTGENPGIRETNELNNTYETPVRMRVHINGFRVWQPCESFLDFSQSAEFRFRVWVSHRSPEGEVTQVGLRNHPWVGELDYYWGEDEGNEHIGEWDLHDNELFTFEFDMPADHVLMVQADGNEIDPGGSDMNDYAGRIMDAYNRGQNYGHSGGQYESVGEGWHECHDGTPLGWDENTFLMRYTITRIH